MKLVLFKGSKLYFVEIVWKLFESFADDEGNGRRGNNGITLSYRTIPAQFDLECFRALFCEERSGWKPHCARILLTSISLI